MSRNWERPTLFGCVTQARRHERVHKSRLGASPAPLPGPAGATWKEFW